MELERKREKEIKEKRKVRERWELWWENFMLQTYVPCKVHTVWWCDARNITHVAHLFREKNSHSLLYAELLLTICNQAPHFRLLHFSLFFLRFFFHLQLLHFPLNFCCSLCSFATVVPQAKGILQFSSTSMALCYGFKFFRSANVWHFALCFFFQLRLLHFLLNFHYSLCSFAFVVPPQVRISIFLHKLTVFCDFCSVFCC